MLKIKKKKAIDTIIADNMFAGDNEISKENKFAKIFPTILLIISMHFRQSLFLVIPLSDEPKIVKMSNDNRLIIRENIKAIVMLTRFPV